MVRDNLVVARRWALDHPVLVVALVALVARAMVATVLNVSDTWSLAPDAGQYLAVAEASADGRIKVFWLGYGESLYRSTWAYTAQIAALFEIFGPFRSLGQAVSVAYGALTAAATASLALRVVRRPFALGAGLIVALAPSQVLWSSVALRESLVWAVLAIVGLILLRVKPTSNQRSVLIVVAWLGLAYLALVHLRNQTAFLMLWSAACALAISPGNRLARVSLAVLFLIAVPWSVGRSIADLEFLSRSAGRLGTVRTYMAMEAETAIVAPELYLPDSSRNGTSVLDADGGVATAVPSGTVVRKSAVEPLDGQTPSSTSTTLVVRAEGDQVDAVSTTTAHVGVLDRTIEESEAGQKFVIDLEGRAVSVHNDLSATLSAFPRGLVAVSIRPFPWEEWTSSRRFMASAESVFWLPLIIAAGAGIWCRRRELALIAFPALLAVTVLVSGAVTHGNLGTAFRHRGQILWALAVLASAGLQWWVDRRKIGEDQ